MSAVIAVLMVHTKEYHGRHSSFSTMQINQGHIDTIKTGFQQMKTKEDLLELVNFTKTLVYGEKAKPVPLKTLTYFGNIKAAGSAYKEFSIRKKSGGTRKIHSPVKGLKPIQKALNLILQCVFTPHKAATGFVPEKSIVDNARVHRGMNYVYNIDLKDFFPSIDRIRVDACLRIPPFNVVYTEEAPLAFLIANLCCTPIEVERKNDKGEWEKKIMSVLPQGAPTSPSITNIVCQRLDKKLSGLAHKHGAQYTRYADDITFSSMHNIYEENSEFLKLNKGYRSFIKDMVNIIEEQRFSINPKKTRLQKSVYRQEVTGLVVNEKVNVRRRYIKQIRHWLYLWERYGYVQAEAIFKNKYRADKGHVKKGEPSLQNVLDGKLLFLKMVKGDGDKTYQKLHERFKVQTEKLAEIADAKVDLDAVLNTLFKKGLEDAMDLFLKFKNPI
jgi:RNA-directed DNA polymerase